MADKDPPAMGSDRARRINSLHKSVNDAVQEQNKKTLQVSSEISSLTKEQQRLMGELDAERGQFTSETASAYNGVVKSLGQTIKNLSSGVKNITTDTAKATSGVIGQYGKAIGEDISLNKQNTMAMALAKATPLFGYFAAKFMETDVFQQSAQKIKETVSNTLSSAGESLVNVFRKKQKTEIEGAPPKLQEGGYIKKGGIVEVHAAEVISPVDKLLDQLGPGNNDAILEQLTSINEELKVTGAIGKDTQKALLKSVNELKVAMIGTVSQLSIAWQRTLLEHPSLRNMLVFGQTMQTVVTAPFKAIFGLRGGFAGDVKRATSTSNVYKQQVNLLALIYTRGMGFLKNIDKYTNVTASALVGEEVSPTSNKTYTLFGKIKEFMTSRRIKTDRSLIFEDFAKNLNLDRSALKEAGISSFSDLLNPVAILRNMGMTKENIKDKSGATWAQNKMADMSEKILGSLHKNQKTNKKVEEDKISIWQKMKKHSKMQTNKLGGIRSSFKKAGKKIKGWFPLIFAIVAKIGNSIFRIVKPIISLATSLGLFFARGAGKVLRKAAPAVGRVGGKAAGALGKAGTATKGAFATGGVKGVTKLAGKGAVRGLGVAARGAGVAARVGSGAVSGLVVGGVMSAIDISKAIMNPEEFVGGIFTRGVAGFLGGSDTGAAGAAHGAMKGGALGAAVGSIVPGFGTIIGGAIGTAAGGILGFIGGKKISAALKNTMDGIKSIISGIWKVVKFPFQVLRELGKSAYYLMKHGLSKIWTWVDDWLSGPGFVGTIWGGIKGVFSSITGFVGKILSSITGFIGGMWDGIKGVFSSMWDSVKSMFSSEGLDKVKTFITNAIFPIPLIIQAFKELGTMAHEWISGMPVIGNIYKKIRGGVKSIRSGDMSESLKRALEGKPELLSETQKSKMTAETIADIYAKEEAAKDKSRENAARKAAEENKKATEQQTKDRNKVQVQSNQTSVTSSSNQSNTTNNNGSGGFQSAFSTGQRTAEKVAAANQT